MSINRRSFLKTGVATLAAGTPLLGLPAKAPNSLLERICLFTDHLDDHGFTYKEVASMLRELKVAGPDLTVRPGGLVLPERVAEDLPRPVEVFREHGLTVPMISTGITSVRDRAAAPTLQTMAKLGIKYYKLGYYPYGNADQWEARLSACRKDLEGLIQLGKQHGVQAGFHNHAGPIVGGALWDSWELLQPLDATAIGFYFDPAQATIEGGGHAWKLNFRRLASRLKMVAIKDFVWEKAGGKWRTRWCPLGEGVVRWDEFFPMLARVPFQGPISLHIEYDPGGTTKTERLDKSFAAAERDLKFLRRGLNEAIRG